jgi:hypothetical protein
MFGRAGQLMLKMLEAGGGIEQLAVAHEAVAAHHGNNYLTLLERFYRSHRKALFTLVDSIGLEAVTAERSVLDAVEFVRAIRDRRSDWIGEIAIVERDGRNVTVRVDVGAFASDAWRKVVRDKHKPGMLSRRHLEVCVFSYLAAQLRSGDIASEGRPDRRLTWAGGRIRHRRSSVRGRSALMVGSFVLGDQAGRGEAGTQAE